MMRKQWVVLSIFLSTLCLAADAAADESPRVAITVEPALLLFGGFQGNLELKGPDRYSFLLVGGSDKVVEDVVNPSANAAVDVRVLYFQAGANAYLKASQTGWHIGATLGWQQRRSVKEDVTITVPTGLIAGAHIGYKYVSTAGFTVWGAIGPNYAVYVRETDSETGRFGTGSLHLGVGSSF